MPKKSVSPALCLLSSSAFHELFSVNQSHWYWGTRTTLGNSAFQITRTQRAAAPVSWLIRLLKLPPQSRVFSPFLILLSLYVTFFGQAAHQPHGVSTGCLGAACCCQPSNISRLCAHGFTALELCVLISKCTCVQCQVNIWTGWLYISSLVALALGVLGQVPQLLV